MDYIQRLLHLRGAQEFQPIPGSFPEGQGEQPRTTNGERTQLQKIAKYCLGIPLLLLYYILAAIISLLHVLRPLKKLWAFYDRKNKSLNHEDALSALLDNLSMEHSSSLARNSPEESRLENSFSFASIYNTEGGTLTSFLQPSYAKLLHSISEQGKFGIVYLHDPLIDDCGQFLGPLCTEKFVNMARKYQSLLWMGDITNSEALQVANSFKVRQLPYIGLLAPKSGHKIQLIDTVEGGRLEQALNSLESTMAKHYPNLIKLRQEQQNIELERLVREQQDARFQESLRQDQERDRRREAEEAMQMRQQREDELKQRWLLWRKSVLVDEPPKLEGACKVAIRIADQGRVIRKFNADLPIEEIYAFVELSRLGLLGSAGDSSSSYIRPHDYEYKYPFKLITPVPRVDLDPQTVIRNVDAIYPSGNIVMEFITAD
ncbi:LANO_0G09714g1_1 [Lachancea nothofagi CBS 11611]|uniref:LANO_0G09714g1_1 n=1 Tax=Lachancea nothofagi CBS 11611 TaxID=1266666 RepID=A0A1G4KIP9_9SACH|nr:LANO_0G09714g1_1 [Lachancea nothofagi CBS 11611]